MQILYLITKNSGRLLNLFSQIELKVKKIIKLGENSKMIDNATEIAKLFSEHVVNIVKRLGLITNKQSAENSLSEVEIAIAK